MLDIVCLLPWGKLKQNEKALLVLTFIIIRWKQGEALGSKSEGIIAPIEAIIRKKGRGLGS